MLLEDGSSSAGVQDGEGQLGALTGQGLMPSWRSRGMTGGQMARKGQGWTRGAVAGWAGEDRRQMQEGVWGCPRASRWGWKRSLRGRASAGEKPLQRGSRVEKSGAP